MNKIIKVLDCFTWIMMLVTFIIAIMTTIVVFGVLQDVILYNFVTFYLLEISLSITLFLWGITTLFEMKDRSAKKHGIYSIIFATILMVFFLFGIY